MRALRLLPLLAAMTAFAAVPLPSDPDTWTVRTAGEFRIYSNAPDHTTGEVARNLLRMREALGRLTPLNVHSPLPMYVFVFRNQRSFAPYADALFGKTDAQVSGGFLPTRFGNFIAIDASSKFGVDRVVYHELTHFFLRNTLPSLPLWLDEGLAEYYSTFGVSGEHRDRVKIGRPIPDHVFALRKERLIPFAQYFAIDHTAPQYTEGPQRKIFYAQSWALMHYFLSGNAERRAKFSSFVADLSAGIPAATAMKKLDLDAAAMEHEIRSYVSRPSMAYVEYRISELAIPDPSPAKPLAPDELLYALGSLLTWNRTSQSDGEGLLQEAVRLNPRHAGAHATLGYLRSVQGDREGALPFFEKAIALGSRDAMPYLIYGQALLEQGQEPLRARQLFQRATELDANDARAWAGLGATYVDAEGDPGPGIAALETSLRLDAAQGDVPVNLIQLYAEAGRSEAVRRMYDRIAMRSTSEVHLRIAREAMEFVEVRAAERLFDAGKRDEAIEAMRRILAKTQDEELQDHLRGVIGSYEEHTSREQQAQTIRDIVEKANAGRTKEALALLDALLPDVEEESVRLQLEELRRQLAKRR